MTEDVLLDIDNLSVCYQGWAARPAIDGVSLRLCRGQAVGIAGESGSGKSTLAMAITGLLASGATMTGRIVHDGRDLASSGLRYLRTVRGKRIATIFQENITALNPVIAIGPQMRRAVRAHARLSRREADVRCGAALEQVRLQDHQRILASYPHQLSGGMCQRVQIAMALAAGAEILIADEPTTALDVSVQAEILGLLRKLVGQDGLGLIIISHDLGVLDMVTDQLLVMQDGLVVESGKTSEVLAAPSHPYTRELLASLQPITSDESPPPRGVSQSDANPTSATGGEVAQ